MKKISSVALVILFTSFLTNDIAASSLSSSEPQVGSEGQDIQEVLDADNRSYNGDTNQHIFDSMHGLNSDQIQNLASFLEAFSALNLPFNTPSSPDNNGDTLNTDLFGSTSDDELAALSSANYDDKGNILDDIRDYQLDNEDEEGDDLNDILALVDADNSSSDQHFPYPLDYEDVAGNPLNQHDDYLFDDIGANSSENIDQPSVGGNNSQARPDFSALSNGNNSQALSNQLDNMASTNSNANVFGNPSALSNLLGAVFNNMLRQVSSQSDQEASASENQQQQTPVLDFGRLVSDFQNLQNASGIPADFSQMFSGAQNILEVPSNLNQDISGAPMNLNQNMVQAPSNSEVSTENQSSSEIIPNPPEGITSSEVDNGINEAIHSNRDDQNASNIPPTNLNPSAMISNILSNPSVASLIQQFTPPSLRQAVLSPTTGTGVTTNQSQNSSNSGNAVQSAPIDPSVSQSTASTAPANTSSTSTSTGSTPAVVTTVQNDPAPAAVTQNLPASSATASSTTNSTSNNNNGSGISTSNTGSIIPPLTASTAPAITQSQISSSPSQNIAQIEETDDEEEEEEEQSTSTSSATDSKSSQQSTNYLTIGLISAGALVILGGVGYFVYSKYASEPTDL